MQSVLLLVDKISTRVGQLAAWSIVALTLLIGWEVFSRYVLSNPHPWVMDASNMLYGALFMLAGAYTLSKNGHVRGDVLYGFFQPRTQAFFDLHYFAGAERTFVDRRRRPADLSVQGNHPGSRPAAAHSGSGGDRSLCDLPENRRLALARGGRRGGRCRQAEGDGHVTYQ